LPNGNGARLVGEGDLPSRLAPVCDAYRCWIEDESPLEEEARVSEESVVGGDDVACCEVVKNALVGDASPLADEDMVNGAERALMSRHADAGGHSFDDIDCWDNDDVDGVCEDTSSVELG
jgi:hypothetical protein